MKIKNNCLHDKLEKATEKVISFLALVPKESFPVRFKNNYRFEDHGFQVLQEPYVDYAKCFLDFKEKISQLPEVLDCVEYMSKNNTIKRTLALTDNVGKPINNPQPIAFYDFNLRFFWQHYLENTKAIVFNKQTFEEAYADLEKFFYKSTVEVCNYTPLENFSFDGEIELTKKVKIRKILVSEKSELQKLLESSSFGGFGGFNLNIIEISNVLEIMSQQRRRQLNTNNFNQTFEDIITTLRLHKQGSVNFHVVGQKSDLWQPFLARSFSSSSWGYVAPIGNKYVLELSEKQRFVKLFKLYSEFQFKNQAQPNLYKYMIIAINRFNLGVEETEIEDKIIDFMIAFEALFLHDQRGELTLRLSNRVAILLGKDAVERENIREVINKSYRLRSDIVHGNEKQEIRIQGQPIQERDLALKIEDILRKSILAFIRMNVKQNQSVDLSLFDRSLLNQKLMKELQKKACVG